MNMSDKKHWKGSDKFREVSLDDNEVKKLTLEMDIKQESLSRQGN